MAETSLYKFKAINTLILYNQEASKSCSHDRLSVFQTNATDDFVTSFTPSDLFLLLMKVHLCNLVHSSSVSIEEMTQQHGQ